MAGVWSRCLEEKRRVFRNAGPARDHRVEMSLRSSWITLPIVVQDSALWGRARLTLTRDGKIRTREASIG